MLQNCERVGRVGENVRPWESVACGKVKRNIRFVSIHIYNVFKFHAKKNRGCDPKVSTGIRNTLFYPRINISVLRFNCRWVRCSISIVNVGNDILACSSTMVSSEKNILA